MDEVREITEAMAVDRDLVVRATPSPPRWALGDANRTRHVLLNLGSNAVRYTPSGAITFALETDGAEVGVSVRDTGPGSAPEHGERIFDRVFRADQSRSRELQAGSGREAGGGQGAGGGDRVERQERRLGERLLEARVPFPVVSVVEMELSRAGVANRSRLVDQHEARPITDAVGIPRTAVVVLGVGIGDALAGEGPGEIAFVVLAGIGRGLGRGNADGREPAFPLR